MIFPHCAVVVALLLLHSQESSAQVQTIGVFPHSTFSTLKVAPKSRYWLPPVDNARILATELIAQQSGVKPYKFGESVPFSLNIHRDGEWSIDPSGTARVWRAVIQSVGAESLSALFSDFYLPPSAEFYIVGRNVVYWGARAVFTNAAGVDDVGGVYRPPEQQGGRPVLNGPRGGRHDCARVLGGHQ